jgi:hypothetical protein
MPRQARLDVPGALHHIMVRGINKSAIFEDDRDRSRFLERLGQTLLETQSSVYAWVLMEWNLGTLMFGFRVGPSQVLDFQTDRSQK